MEFLNRGTYGEVYKVDNEKVLKKCDLFESKKYLSSANIVETCFVKTFRDVSFITEAIDVKVEKKKLNIVQKYKGKNLVEFAKDLSYVERVKFLPDLLAQLARILMWLKRHRVVHMDIKNGNICIDNQRNVTLIDFGFVGMVHNFSAIYHGTRNFADPNYLDKNVRISYDYDMFACGVVIESFLSKDSCPDPYNLDISVYKKDIELVLGSDAIFNILKSMICLDSSKRISAEELYHSVKIFWDKYPLFGIKEEIKVEPINYSNQSEIKDYMVGILTDWLIDVMGSTNTLEMAGHVIKTLFRVLEKLTNIQKRDFQLFGSAVLYVCAIIHMHDGKINPKTLVHYADNCYNQKELLDMSIFVCKTLKWEIYPVGQITEGYLTNPIDRQEIKKLYVKNNIPTEYCTLSEEEKYGYLKKLGYTLLKNSEL